MSEIISANRPIIPLTCIAVLLGASSFLPGGDAETQRSFEPANIVAQTVPTDLEKEQALQEIMQIKSRLGGSVLKGSLLDGTDAEEVDPLDNSLREIMDLPTAKTNSRPSAVRPSEPMAVVSKMRSRIAQLDRVANEIEAFRHYRSADELREIAGELRLIARQLDVPPASGRASIGPIPRRSTSTPSGDNLLHRPSDPLSDCR